MMRMPPLGTTWISFIVSSLRNVGASPSLHHYLWARVEHNYYLKMSTLISCLCFAGHVSGVKIPGAVAY